MTVSAKSHAHLFPSLVQQIESDELEHALERTQRVGGHFFQEIHLPKGNKVQEETT